MSEQWNEFVKRLFNRKVDGFIRRSGQVECPIPHHPRRDGEPCGACGAQV